jgi:hypothetical protein
MEQMLRKGKPVVSRHNMQRQYNMVAYSKNELRV